MGTLVLGMAYECKHPRKKADQTFLQLPPAFAAIPPMTDDDQDSTPPDVTQNLVQQLPKPNSAIITM